MQRQGPPDQEPWWEDWRMKLLLVVMILFLLVGLVMTTPVPPWYYR